MKCAKCKLKRCYIEGGNCTRITHDEVKAAYKAEDENIKIMEAAACTEAEGYNQITRLEETAEFCKKMGVKKIGVAFCIGLRYEASFVHDYLSKFFTVESVCCKVCSLPKSEMELAQINPGTREAMCNPMIQAKILNEAGCELNFTVGLCVGHDMLFGKASSVPVSSIITKDRVLAHNPAGAIYSRYWKRKLGILPDDQV